jgi:hypothetical protein
MTFPTLLTAIVEALRSAGATEEIIAAAVKAGGEFCYSPPPGAAAARATMPTVRRASALIDGVTKFETKFPRVRVALRNSRRNSGRASIGCGTKPLGAPHRCGPGLPSRSAASSTRAATSKRTWCRTVASTVPELPRPGRLIPVFPQHLGRCATPRLARLGAEPRRVPFDEARAVPRDEFVPCDGRRAPGRRRSLKQLIV